jgi:uncharacterized membrane protein
MDKETEDTLTKIAKHIFRMDINILIALVLIGVFGVKGLIDTTRTTKALSEVAQRVGVDFPTKTNNVLWVWQVVKPK